MKTTFNILSRPLLAFLGLQFAFSGCSDSLSSKQASSVVAPAPNNNQSYGIDAYANVGDKVVARERISPAPTTL
jgi:predicted phage tail protein